MDLGDLVYMGPIAPANLENITPTCSPASASATGLGGHFEQRIEFLGESIYLGRDILDSGVLIGIGGREELDGGHKAVEDRLTIGGGVDKIFEVAAQLFRGVWVEELASNGPFLGGWG